MVIQLKRRSHPHVEPAPAFTELAIKRKADFGADRTNRSLVVNAEARRESKIAERVRIPVEAPLVAKNRLTGIEE